MPSLVNELAPKRLTSAVAVLLLALPACSSDRSKTVTAKVQPRPGAAVQEIEMGVHEVPVDLPTVSASEADLEGDDLVLGLHLDGEAVAYPIRYLALSEVVNGSVGDQLVAPTW